MRIGHTSEVYVWLSNKLLCKIYIRDTLNYLNSHCNTAKLLWVVIYVVCFGWFSPDLVVINICRQRLIKVDRRLWQRSLANENAVVCRQGAMHWRLWFYEPNTTLQPHLTIKKTQMLWFCFSGTYRRFLNTIPGHYSENPNPTTLIFWIVPWGCVQKSLVPLKGHHFSAVSILTSSYCMFVLVMQHFLEFRWRVQPFQLFFAWQNSSTGH